MTARLKQNKTDQKKPMTFLQDNKSEKVKYLWNVEKQNKTKPKGKCIRMFLNFDVFKKNLIKSTHMHVLGMKLPTYDCKIFLVNWWSGIWWKWSNSKNMILLQSSFGLYKTSDPWRLPCWILNVLEGFFKTLRCL